jgi:hypothetical protein
MSDFLSNYDVIANTSSLNESLLSWVNIIREMGLKPVCNAFSNDFVYYIAKANGSIVSWN